MRWVTGLPGMAPSDCALAVDVTLAWRDATPGRPIDEILVLRR